MRVIPNKNPMNGMKIFRGESFGRIFAIDEKEILRAVEERNIIPQVNIVLTRKSWFLI
jgi:hypothetical protein